MFVENGLSKIGHDIHRCQIIENPIERFLDDVVLDFVLNNSFRSNVQRGLDLVAEFLDLRSTLVLKLLEPHRVVIPVRSQTSFNVLLRCEKALFKACVSKVMETTPSAI